jgi:prevent-host-death family protein
MKKTVSITEFKSKCLSYIRDVDEKGVHLVITKHGKSIAEVQPVLNKRSGQNPLKDSVLKQDDILSPIDTDWEVLKE